MKKEYDDDDVLYNDGNECPNGIHDRERLAERQKCDLENRIIALYIE